MCTRANQELATRRHRSIGVYLSQVRLINVRATQFGCVDFVPTSDNFVPTSYLITVLVEDIRRTKKMVFEH